MHYTFFVKELLAHMIRYLVDIKDSGMIAIELAEAASVLSSTNNGAHVDKVVVEQCDMPVSYRESPSKWDNSLDCFHPIRQPSCLALLVAVCLPELIGTFPCYENGDMDLNIPHGRFAI